MDATQWRLHHEKEGSSGHFLGVGSTVVQLCRRPPTYSHTGGHGVAHAIRYALPFADPLSHADASAQPLAHP